jgi:hypothetical protein
LPYRWAAMLAIPLHLIGLMLAAAGPQDGVAGRTVDPAEVTAPVRPALGDGAGDEPTAPTPAGRRGLQPRRLQLRSHLARRNGGHPQYVRDAEGLKLEGCILYTSSEPCPLGLSTAYWAGLDGIIYGAFATDSKKYGNFDDVFIYEEFARPIEQRKIPEMQVLRDEAVTVWKEYASLPDNVPY